jgi:hypothetical protein
MTESSATDKTRHKNVTFPAVLRRIELMLVLLFALAWIMFHVRFFLNAGSLWRDEVTSVDLCNLPHISDTWNNVEYDSFPMLWHLLLRYWIRSGIGATDQGLRLLGLLAAVGILAAIFFNARLFRVRPIISLALLGFCSAVICYGGSVRAYGLGIMLQLFTFGLIWKVATRPTIWNVIAASLVSLAGVQMLFYNTVMLAAVSCGAFAVTALHRQWKRAGIIALIGLVCAVSMTIYTPMNHRRAAGFGFVFHSRLNFWQILHRFADAVSFTSDTAPDHSLTIPVAWAIATLIAVLLGAVALILKNRRPTDPFRTDLVIYQLTALCTGVVGYFSFLWKLSYNLQPWYFLAIMALIAVCCDGLIGSARSAYGRTLICLSAATFAAMSAPNVWLDAGLQKSAIESDASRLADLSKPGDLVLISPFYYGVTFQRYFHGPADYQTVPAINILLFQKYDTIAHWMQNFHATDSTIQRMSNVLKSGHVLFLLGEFRLQSTDRAYPIIPRPAPNNSFGSTDADFYDLWQRQITYILARHATQSVVIPVEFEGVSRYERPWLIAVRGWTEQLRKGIR